jgi:hypothetical protein
LAVPKKEPDTQSHQKEQQQQQQQQQQQSKSLGSDKEYDKEQLEAVRRYCVVCFILYMSSSGVLKNKE